MGTTRISQSRPKKGRTPKCPDNVRRRWSPKYGWRFRAVKSINGHKHVGPWCSTIKEAQKGLDEIEERSKIAAVDDVPVTVGEAVQLMLKRAEERGFRKRKIRPCRPETLEFYRVATNTILREVGPETVLRAMDANQIQDYLAHRAAQQRRACRCDQKGIKPCPHAAKRPSAARLNKERQTWGLIWRTAIEAGHRGANPITQVDEYDVQKRESPHYSLDRIREVLAAILERTGSCKTARWFADVVALLFTTGLRVGELAHLRTKDIDLRHGELKVSHLGKTGSRTIPLREIHVDILRRLTDGRDDYLLPGDSPKQRKTSLTSNAFPRWRRRLPEHLRDGFRAHVLRHSFRTFLAEEGVPRHHRNKLTGHADGDMGDVYEHAAPAQVRQSMARVFDGLALWPKAATAQATTG